MTTPAPTPIDALLWTATRYSDVLGVDRRKTAQVLEKLPSTIHNGVRVWHIRDALQLKDESAKKNPNDMEPKDALDYYRAQRERIKLAEDIRKMIPAADIERVIGEAFKALAQSLDALPDALERDCGLPALAVTAAQRAVDTMRETLYANLTTALAGADG